MIRSPDYMIATATRLLLPSCLLPNEVQHSHLTCILLTWLQKEENSKVIQASGSCSLRSALLYISQNEGHTHSRIQYQSQKVFLENRFNRIQIRNVLHLSPKPHLKFSRYMKHFLGKMFEYSKRNLHISSVLIYQKVHNQKISTSEPSTRCLDHSLWRKRRGEGITVTARI